LRDSWPWRLVRGGADRLTLVAYLVVTSSDLSGACSSPRERAPPGRRHGHRHTVHPFRQILVHNLKVQVKGQEPFITRRKIRANYRPSGASSGQSARRPKSPLVSPTITLVENPDGSRNTDALVRALSEKAVRRPGRRGRPNLRNRGRWTSRKSREQGQLFEIRTLSRQPRDFLEVAM